MVSCCFREGLTLGERKDVGYLADYFLVQKLCCSLSKEIEMFPHNKVDILKNNF